MTPKLKDRNVEVSMPAWRYQWMIQKLDEALEPVVKFLNAEQAENDAKEIRENAIKVVKKDLRNSIRHLEETRL